MKYFIDLLIAGLLLIFAIFHIVSDTALTILLSAAIGRALFELMKLLLVDVDCDEEDL